MHIRDIVEYCVPEEEVHDFMTWALGPEYKEIVSTDYPDQWNAMHGHWLTIDPMDDPKDDIPRMYDVWKTKIKASS